MLSIVIFVSSFSLNASGAYLVDVGDEWTYGIILNGDYKGSEGIKIVYVPDPPDQPRGDLYINGTVDEYNQTINEDDLIDEAMIAAYEANSTKKTRTYAGMSRECLYIKVPDGYMYIDILTGIVVEKYASADTPFGRFTVHIWVISWSVTDIPEDPEEPSTGGGGDIPGYDILFIIGIIAVISTILTIGFKKKFKT